MKLETGGSIVQDAKGIWQFSIGTGKNRIRKSTGTRDAIEAAQLAAGYIDKTLLTRIGISIYSSATSVSIKHYTEMYRNTKKNSVKRNIPFDLTKDDLNHLIKRSKDACEITGIKFQTVDGSAKFERQPFTPSIDRIDSTLGYSLDNCRLVCVSVNFAINTWGEWVLHEIASAMLKTRKLKPKIPQSRRRQPQTMTTLRQPKKRNISPV